MSITSSNAVLQFMVPLVFPAPIQLQGFSTDDVFGTDSMAEAEVQMGVDGLQSAGYVFVSAKQNYTLQGNSPSNDFFDKWRAAQKAAGEIITADAVIVLKSIGAKYTMTNGVLTGYPPAADAKRVVQPRRYEVTWERIEKSAA